jgi:serine/threonine-protein kinase
MDSLTAHLVKHYSIEAEIGDCGLGRLFEASSASLGSRVTILVLSESATGDQQFAERFDEQMRRAQGVHHRALMAVTHFAHENGTYYVVMEHSAGRTVAQALAQGAVPRLRDAVAVCQRTAEGLDFAHRSGLVHGALHLDTIVVSERWEARVLGLGIAKAADPVSLSTSAAWPPAGYRSPEQRAGVPLDARADIYGLGAVLYRLLTGAAPAHDGEVASPGSLNAQVPPTLGDALMRMLARKPRERPQTARECAALLSRLSLPREAADAPLPAGEPETADAQSVAAQEISESSVRTALTLYRTRQWEAAVAHLEEMARASPRGTRVLAYLGAAHYAVGQYAEAAEALRRAVSLRPESARLHYNLASALLGLGDVNEARNEFERAWNLDPAYTAAALAIAALDGADIPG